MWPAGWQVLELNPAHVAEQRPVQGRRGIKTDALELEAITELVLAGRGMPVTAREVAVGQLAAWARTRLTGFRPEPRRRTSCWASSTGLFPGLTLVLPDVLGTKVGLLVASDFADPKRLAALGAVRFIRFAAARGFQVRRALAERLVTAARDALTTTEAAVARQVLAADLALPTELCRGPWCPGPMTGASPDVPGIGIVSGPV